MWSRSTPLCLVGSLVFVYCFVDPCSFFLFRPLCGLSAFNVLLQSTSLVSSNSSSYTHPRRVSHIEQELRTLPEHLSSPTGFSGIRVACSIFFFCILLVIPFVSTIVLSVLEFTASDYSFAIFKLFILYSRRVPQMEQELLTVPEHPSSPTGFSGVRVACSIFRFFLYIVLFVQFVCFRCLSSDLQILFSFRGEDIC
jgi:hypothetical protein